jgi:uncharacterized membrane protein
MTQKQFKTAQMMTAAFISIVVAMAVATNNLILAFGAALVGVVFMLAVKRRVKQPLIDERVIAVSGRAAGVSYSVTVVTLAVLSVVLTILGRSQGSAYVQGLGNAASFTVLFAMAAYAVAFWHFNRKYGGNQE